jgi:serine/threonine protein phosphatase PrpC
LITDQEIIICHVGKNRAYFLPEQPSLRRLTVDHSIVESLVVAGLIQREEVYTHPKRNRIFRCLGQGPQVEIDTLHVPATSGDRLLFCSDGLWEVVRDPALEEVLRRHADVAQATTQLITLAKERDGRDDITAIVVDLIPDGAPAKRPGISQIRSNRTDLAV